ncbi:MAG: hypothetical protein AAGA89_07150 [Pseudomonadota bacterium]
MSERDRIWNGQVYASEAIVSKTLGESDKPPQYRSAIFRAKEVFKEIQQTTASRLPKRTCTKTECCNLRPWTKICQRFAGNKTGIHFKGPFRELGCNMLLKVWEEFCCREADVKSAMTSDMLQPKGVM